MSPLETEPIVAYRAWKLRESFEGLPVLYSSVQDFVWLPFEAAHGDPESGEGGIYAFKSIDFVKNTYLDHESIAGEVYLWGTVLEHDEGYRAEFGYPKAFLVHKDFDASMIVRLEDTYGVPVLISDDIDKVGAPKPAPPMRFSYGGVQPGILEVVRDVIYDREILPAGGRVHLFVIPLGQISNAAGIKPPQIKNWNHTNMYMCGQLDAPREFVVKQIRCAFFEQDGRPVPLTDPIYWEACLRFSVNMKTYWQSPAGLVADPGLAMGATDFSKIPAAERLQLLNVISGRLTAPATSMPSGVTAEIDGIQIRQQEPFKVEVDLGGSNKWLGREVFVALEGVGGRGVV